MASGLNALAILIAALLILPSYQQIQSTAADQNSATNSTAEQEPDSSSGSLSPLPPVPQLPDLPPLPPFPPIPPLPPVPPVPEQYNISNYNISQYNISQFNSSEEYKKIKKRINKHINRKLFDVCWGLILGPSIIIVAMFIIFYNEKRAAINRYRIQMVQHMIAKKGDHLVKGNLNINKDLNIMNEFLLDHADLNKDKLVYVVGKVRGVSPASDQIVGIKDSKTLKLVRQVEVRQYRKINRKKKDPPQLQWCSYHFSQAGDKTNSIQNWFLKSQTFLANQAYVNQYKLNLQELDSLPATQKVPLAPLHAFSIIGSKKIPQCFSKQTPFLIHDDYIYFPTVANNRLSHGTLRVRYFACTAPEISFIASANGNKNLQPFNFCLHDNYTEPDHLYCGQLPSIFFCCRAADRAFQPLSELDVAVVGRKEPDQLLKQYIKHNKQETNRYRLIGYFVMTVGVFISFMPMIEILGYIPFVGGFLQGTAAGLAFIGAILVCAPTFFIIFGFAWAFHRPKTGFIAIGIAIGFILLFIVLDYAGGGFQDQLTLQECQQYLDQQQNYIQDEIEDYFNGTKKQRKQKEKADKEMRKRCKQLWKQLNPQQQYISGK